MPDIRRCVFGCVTNGIVLHNFPNPTRFPERFQLWVNLVGEPVENLAPSEIYGKKKVCDLHFTADDRNRNNRLNAIAVPVPFPYQKRPPIRRHRKPYTSSTSLVNQTELYRDPDLDPDEESGAIYKEQVEESIVPVAKTFTWENKNEAVCIKPEVRDAADNESLYLDDSEPSLPHLDVRYDVDPTLHEGFQCDVCKGEIVGFRYTCVQCNDFDLCSSCEANKTHHHHYVLRVPQRRPYAEIQLVLATIRRHLMQNLDPITDFDEDLNDNLSIKSEIKSEIEDVELNDEEISSQDLSHSADKSTPPQPQEQTDHQEDHIEMNSQEETESYDQIMEQNIISSSKSTPLIQNEQLKRTCSKPKPPIMLSTAKKKILIKLDDFIKVKDGIPSAKKIRVLPIAKNKSDDKTQTALTHKPQFKPVNKMMFLKLPGAILKDAPKVPIQNLPLSIAMKHSADVDNE